MENKLIEIKKLVTKPENRIKLIIVIGVVSILLVLLSDIAPTDKKSEQKSPDYYTTYSESLESEAEEIISSIDGVGRCKVMLTLAETKESVYARNKEESGGNGNYSASDEYVLYDGDDGDTPLVIKEYFPTVSGVVVVCTGADNKVVRECVISCISSLFDVPTNKITVSKFKG